MFGNFCGNDEPHVPHDKCLGIMCDTGCGCVDEGAFYAIILEEA